MAEPHVLTLPDPAATEALGLALARALAAVRQQDRPLVLWLEGSLGAGKTTLARALLRGLGHGGRVPSPTYTLVEPYELPGGRVLHLDLYRLADGAELEYLGLADELSGPTLLLVEWPRQGGDRVPPPDLELRLDHAGPGRQASLTAVSPPGRAILSVLAGGAILTIPGTRPGI